MTESVQAREKSGSHERCPFCHEEFSAATPGHEADERVTCAGCGTPHHAECFSENGGCSSLGCERREARAASGAEVPATLLDPSITAGREWTTLGLILVGATIFGIGLVLYSLAPGVVAQAVAVLGGLLGFVGLGMRAMGRALANLPIDEMREQGTPILATRAPLHGREVFEQMLNRPTAAPVAPGEDLNKDPTGPSRPCPSCGQTIEATDGLRFCYHCGVSLT